MAHFAKLNDNNVVLEIHCVSNDILDPQNEELTGIAFLKQWSGGYENWKQTSYNSNFRKQFAGINYVYDPINDVFIAPKPFASWSLNSNFDWQAPKAKPTTGDWSWNENEGEWVEFVS